MNIGIVGGGIGGTAAAVALQRAGIDTVVYERAPAFREVGAGMMLWPNATRVLRDLGMLEPVLQCSGSNTHFLVRTSDGTVLMNIALGKFDVPAICMRRSDLLAILLAPLPKETMRLGHQLVDVKQSKDKVRLSFQNGFVAEHDAVIGADGIRSRVRLQLFGQSDPIYRGYAVWRGVARYNGDGIIPGVNSETWGAGSRFGILHVGPGKFTWYATANQSSDHADAPGDCRRELPATFHGWHKPIPQLIAATEPEEIVKHGAYDSAPLRCWSKGRITLMGDAAHPCTPNLGQGGCMALEDAAMLARCLTEQTSPAAAFRRYETLRRHRTRNIQQRSRVIGEIGQWEIDSSLQDVAW